MIIPERPALRLHLDGRGGLLPRLSPLQARQLFARLMKVNRLTRHEQALFCFDSAEEPPLPKRLRFQRPPAFISPLNLRRMEGLCNARILDRTWRLDLAEGRFHLGTLPGRRPGTMRRGRYVPLFGMIFEVERLSTEALFQGPPRDVLAERGDRSVALVRFEKIVIHQDSLALSLRDRTRLDRCWFQSLSARHERDVSGWFAIRNVLPQPEFILAETPSLLR